VQADLIFKGGPIYTSATGTAEAIAVVGDKVVAAGTEAAVLNLAGPGTRVHHLEGRTLLPGLVDAHLHVLGYGIGLRQVLLADVSDLSAALARIGERAAATPRGEWVLGRGFVEDKWAVKRLPTRDDLDRVSPHHPVLITRACGHIAVANTAALREAGVRSATPNPQGGHIDRDTHGEPTGVLREKAIDLVGDVVPELTYTEKRDALLAAVTDAASRGITDLHSDDVRQAGTFADSWRLWNEVAGPEAFPMRGYLLMYHEAYEEFRTFGLKRGDGNAYVRQGMIKLFADGSLGGHTAALLAPYADDPATNGLYIHKEADFIAMVARYHRDGYQIGCHCIGDGAIQLFLDAVEAANRQSPRPDHRHRMIHAQCNSPALMQRMRQLKVVGDIQPKFIHSDGYFYQERLGAERARWFNPWQTMITMGIPCCGGSDCPVEPLHMPWQLHAAVARQDLNGRPEGGWNPAERLSIAQTIAIHTEGAAYAAFEEGIKGNLAPGMLADLVVLDRDPYHTPPADLQDLKVHLTMVGGRVAFER
jgi:predicted amidohydrolase YtcJ